MSRQPGRLREPPRLDTLRYEHASMHIGRTDPSLFGAFGRWSKRLNSAAFGCRCMLLISRG
jgi:hypothetical protein